MNDIDPGLIERIGQWWKGSTQPATPASIARLSRIEMQASGHANTCWEMASANAPDDPRRSTLRQTCARMAMQSCGDTSNPEWMAWLVEQAVEEPWIEQLAGEAMRIALRWAHAPNGPSWRQASQRIAGAVVGRGPGRDCTGKGEGGCVGSAGRGGQGRRCDHRCHPGRHGRRLLGDKVGACRGCARAVFRDLDKEQSRDLELREVDPRGDRGGPERERARAPSKDSGGRTDPQVRIAVDQHAIAWLRMDRSARDQSAGLAHGSKLGRDGSLDRA